MARMAFDNSYAGLPSSFYARVLPSSASEPHLIKLNRELARQLGLDPDELERPEGVAVLAGQSVPSGADPIATAYAGHQFGNFTPQLGDGRAILLGELIGRDGIRRDIQLKGSGRTPFSRGGDGRAALGPVLREYLVSEAMAALGVPTTRALAAVTTGETVLRETELPGAVLTRVATSHIRVGTFQFFAARGDMAAVRRLADYAIERHDPGAAGAAQPYRAFLEGVIERQARLVARWMLIGFIHGVMNTDNMSISGETIDYGPCAFMDAYDPATVFSSIDHYGRYAFENQPGIAQWNLARLTECLLPLLSDVEDEALTQGREILGSFAPVFQAAHLDGLRSKLGLATERDGDLALAQDLFIDPTAYDGWAERWRSRLAQEPRAGQERRAAMRAVNPAYIPRNHRVEEVIKAAVQDRDFAPFARLGEVLSSPYEDQPAFAAYADPPPFDSGAYRTFCGT